MAIQIMTTGTLGDKFLKGLSANLKDIGSQIDLEYANPFESALGVEKSSPEKIVKTITTENAREVYQDITGVGYLSLTKQGEDFKQDSYTSAYETDFRPVKYTKLITITEDEKDDRVVNQKLDEAQQLMVAGRMTQLKHIFDIFNKGFTAQASLPDYLTYYGDGVPMFSTIHPLKDSRTSTTTFSNASATSIPLTPTNLETARTAIRQQLGDNGLPLAIGSGRLVLVVPITLEKTAIEITKSEKAAQTANNDINIYTGGWIDVLSTKWLTAQEGGLDTQWFLVDAMRTPIIDMVRKPLTVSTYISPTNKNYNIDIQMRHKVGNRSWRGVWGSKGNGAAYAA